MKHFLIISLLFALCAVLPMPLQADGRVASPVQVVAVAVEGSYRGKMDVTMSKDKTFPGRPATFVLHQGRLTCDFPKIGKMPGKIRIELPVEIDRNGKMTAQRECTAGVMKMPLGFKVKLRLEALENARIVGRQLSFVLKVYGQAMGAKFPTTIHFVGQQP